MDALEGLDQARFERHPGTVPECSWEGTGLREATARLATAAATRPRAALLARSGDELDPTAQQVREYGAGVLAIQAKVGDAVSLAPPPGGPTSSWATWTC
jgi:hypothetical protein